METPNLSILTVIKTVKEFLSQTTNLLHSGGEPLDMGSIEKMMSLKLLRNVEEGNKQSDWSTVEIGNGFEVSRQGGTIRICLNRAGGNALSLSLMKELTSQFNKMSADPSVFRIVITGRGRFFCTGMDLKEDLSGTLEQRKDVLQDFFETIDNCPKPTIAVLNGPAFGGGAGLASVCDVRLASSSAYLCLSEVRLGLCPATISKYIVREWGPSLSRAAMVTGCRMSSHRLYQAGVIHAIGADSEGLEKITKEYLESMQMAAPRASAWCKELVKSTISNDNDRSDDVFVSMLTKGSESSYAIEQFGHGTRGILWDKTRDELPRTD